MNDVYTWDLFKNPKLNVGWCKLLFINIYWWWIKELVFPCNCKLPFFGLNYINKHQCHSSTIYLCLLCDCMEFCLHIDSRIVLGWIQSFNLIAIIICSTFFFNLRIRIFNKTNFWKWDLNLFKKFNKMLSYKVSVFLRDLSNILIFCGK